MFFNSIPSKCSSPNGDSKAFTFLGQNFTAKTRFFEGFLNGLKYTAVHSLVYAPFVAKSVSLEKGTRFASEYTKHCIGAFVFYSMVLGSVCGLRQMVVENKDTILFEL
jgi:hypothetical protein